MSTTDTPNYANVTFSITNAQPSQTIIIDMDTSDHDVAWSTGADFSGSPGISIDMTSGEELPLTGFRITASEIRVETSGAGSGGQIGFNLKLFAAYLQGTKDLTLKSSSDSGIVVKVSINEQVSQVVNSTYSDFRING
ncbi:MULTISPECIES: hypothetical protein [Burkholderia]|uniref:Uncharacterized protein n=1 Tax=Burkholderia gladioli TaxID=28095 RepID=A0A2A7SFI9_BURGA|nr:MULTISPECIES: hypothetical protein [Burkholderia]ATF87459.1 hypothetical protein CO712_20295 [Burkholderia gladioli pv. gladioli]MBJ9660030.1 hypothetical protein [Burkholderia gladioli]MBJ9711488.1 hypothetical protein [Burkholderia gladioli]MBU9158147.1 hypothetical protein [Burkholderia gladioli]MBU9168184.1 hypothetical protein [Burkholderia gladioli]